MRHLSLCLVLGALCAAPALANRDRGDPPDWPGRQGVHAHKAAKAAASLRATTTTPRDETAARPGETPGKAPDPGGRTARGGTASTASGSGASLTSAPATPGSSTTERPARAVPLSVAAAAQLRVETRDAEQKAARTARPLHFRWPSGAQPALSWTQEVREFDGFAIRENLLRTPHATLRAEVLDGYQEPRAEDRSDAGLTLVNSVRPSVRLEFFSFTRRGFLPDLEPAAVQAYQRALASSHAPVPLQLIEAERAWQEYGPGTDDLLTRRVTYRLFPAATGSEPEGPALEVVDFLIPLEREWLVVRFSAPPFLFAGALTEVEAFLERLQSVEPDLATASRN
jgi:hypothetical protein